MFSEAIAYLTLAGADHRPDLALIWYLLAPLVTGRERDARPRLRLALLCLDGVEGTGEPHLMAARLALAPLAGPVAWPRDLAGTSLELITGRALAHLPGATPWRARQRVLQGAVARVDCACCGQGMGRLCCERSGVRAPHRARLWPYVVHVLPQEPGEGHDAPA